MSRRQKQRLQLAGGQPLHEKARGPHPRYKQRARVPDARVFWDAEWPSYEPTEFEHPGVLHTPLGAS